VTLRTGLLLAAAAASLAGCSNTGGTAASGAVRTASGTPESACTTAVNTNMGRAGAVPVRSDVSEAGTVVTLQSDGGTNWRCLATNSGVVQDLSIM
jgi:hypothetical protein